MNITAKLKSVVFKIQWSLNGYNIIHPKNFPEGISLIQYGKYYGLFMKRTNTLLTSVCYQKITYDPSGHNFLGYENSRTHLINLQGIVIFSTFKLPSDAVREYLSPNGDGTYQFITNFYFTGRGWILEVNSNGKIITRPDHHFLFQS